MTWVSNHLSQAALSTAITTQVTGSANLTTQISEIWLANTGSTPRTVTLYSLGTSAVNTLLPISVPANGGQVLQGLKIILNSAETLSANQDSGTDIIMTTYGGYE